MIGLLLLTFCLGGSFTSATPAVRTASISIRCAEIPGSIYKCLSSPKIVINDDLAKSCDNVKTECDRIKCIFTRSGWVSNGQLSRPAMSAYFSNFAHDKPEWRQAVEHIQRECLSGVLPPQGVHMECPEYDVMHCTLIAFIRNNKPHQWLSTHECRAARDFAASCPACPTACFAPTIPAGSCNACHDWPGKP